jgi:hypothetical protein
MAVGPGGIYAINITRTHFHIRGGEGFSSARRPTTAVTSPTTCGGWGEHRLRVGGGVCVSQQD